MLPSCGATRALTTKQGQLLYTKATEANTNYNSSPFHRATQGCTGSFPNTRSLCQNTTVATLISPPSHVNPPGLYTPRMHALYGATIMVIVTFSLRAGGGGWGWRRRAANAHKNTQKICSHLLSPRQCSHRREEPTRPEPSLSRAAHPSVASPAAFAAAPSQAPPRFSQNIRRHFRCGPTGGGVAK